MSGKDNLYLLAPLSGFFMLKSRGMETIQQTNPAMTGKRVRQVFKSLANIIPTQSICTGTLSADDHEYLAAFAFDDAVVTIHMSRIGG